MMMMMASGKTHETRSVDDECKPRQLSADLWCRRRTDAVSPTPPAARTVRLALLYARRHRGVVVVFALVLHVLDGVVQLTSDIRRTVAVHDVDFFHLLFEQAAAVADVDRRLCRQRCTA